MSGYTKRSHSNPMTLIDPYTNKSFAVVGDTYAHKDALGRNGLGGKFVKGISFNGQTVKGWIFPAYKRKSFQHWSETGEIIESHYEPPNTEEQFEDQLTKIMSQLTYTLRGVAAPKREDFLVALSNKLAEFDIEANLGPAPAIPKITSKPAARPMRVINNSRPHIVEDDSPPSVRVSSNNRPPSDDYVPDDTDDQGPAHHSNTSIFRVR